LINVTSNTDIKNSVLNIWYNLALHGRLSYCI